MKTIHSVNLVLLATLVGLSIVVYPELPSSIPLHFGGTGEADRWGDRIFVRWMLLPTVAVLTCAVTYLAAWFSVRDPRSVNLPSKRQLLQLPHDTQMWVLQGIANPIYLM